MRPEGHAMAHGSQGDELVCADPRIIRQVLTCKLKFFTCFSLYLPAGRSLDLNGGIDP